VVLVARADGTLAADVRPLVRLSVTVIAEQTIAGEVRREVGSAAAAAASGWLLPGQRHRKLRERRRQGSAHQPRIAPGQGRRDERRARPGLARRAAARSDRPRLEGDFNRKGSSAFSGRIGQRVGAKGRDVLDDGTLPDRRGSLNVDDEGNATQRNVLIEDGILKATSRTRMNARLMGVAPTGNGRRESYAAVPMPRMTNTYMLGGDKPKEEIIAGLKRGLYATNFGGGQVDITSGKFVFSASEAFWVENGKIQYPVKGATIIGNGPDALTRVSMIGNDMKLDTGVGVCGKEGQSVPVGVGQPTLRIDKMRWEGRPEPFPVCAN